MTTPEAKARQEIDKQLLAAGWILQNMSDMNMMAGLGVAVREYQLTTGEADYGLYIDGKVAGVIEAKKEGSNLLASKPTLKTNPLKRADLDEFVSLYKPEDPREKRRENWSEEEGRRGKSPDGRWRSFTYDEIIKRDKANLDIFWLKDNSLEDSENLPDPEVLAQEIADDLQTALDHFTSIATELKD